MCEFWWWLDNYITRNTIFLFFIQSCVPLHYVLCIKTLTSISDRFFTRFWYNLFRNIEKFDMNRIPFHGFLFLALFKLNTPYHISCFLWLYYEKNGKALLSKGIHINLTFFLLFKMRLMLLKFTIKRNRISPKMAKKSHLEI